MTEKEKEDGSLRPATFWNKVYISVVLTTVVVIAALWSFSRYFR